MISKFITFLDRGTNGVTVKSIWNAITLTRQFYSSRRALRQKYKLSSYHYPFHLYQQRKINIEESKTLAKIYKNKYFPTQSSFVDATKVEYIPIDREELLKETVQTRPSSLENLKSALSESVVEGPLNVKIPGTMINIWRGVKRGEWMTDSSQWIVQYLSLIHI